MNQWQKNAFFIIPCNIMSLFLLEISVCLYWQYICSDNSAIYTSMLDWALFFITIVDISVSCLCTASVRVYNEINCIFLCFPRLMSVATTKAELKKQIFSKKSKILCKIFNDYFYFARSKKMLQYFLMKHHLLSDSFVKQAHISEQ